MEEDWRLSASLGPRARPSAIHREPASTQARPFRARARLAGEPGERRRGHSSRAPARSWDPPRDKGGQRRVLDDELPAAANDDGLKFLRSTSTR